MKYWEPNLNFTSFQPKKKQQQTKFWEIEYIVVYNANIVA